MPRFIRHSPRVRLFAVIGIAAAIFVIAMFFLGSVAKAYNHWRQNRLLQRANTLLNEAASKEIATATRKNDLEQAMRIGKEVLRLRPDSLSAYYVLAEAAEKSNLEETVGWRAQIARLLPHDLDSQLNLASAALRFGQLDLARKALEKVPAVDRDRAPFHVVAGWLARAEGNVSEQEHQFAAAVKKEPGNDLYQFNLAVLRIRSPDPDKRADARATLERLSKTTGFRAGALRALLNDAVERSDFAAADSIAQQLQMIQQVTFNDYLLCLNFYRKLDDKKFGALLQKVKAFAAHDPSEVALLMSWMNTNGLAAEVLEWLDKLPSEISTHPPVAITVAEAFAAAKNWSRLKRWTRTGSWKDADYLRLAYQALAARQSRQSGGEAEFNSLWRSAEREADEQPEYQAQLARLATKWNLTIEADALWSRVAVTPPLRREALNALYHIYRENNELAKIYDVLQRLHQTSPNEPAITANLARLGMNLDQNTDQAHRLAREAYERAPEDTNCAVTYAYSLYGMGRTSDAIEVLKKLPPEQLHDPHAAVYVAAMLLDENQPDAAGEYIQAAAHSRLYVEEKSLLEEAKTKQAALLAAASLSPSPADSPAVLGSSPVAPTATPVPSPTASPLPSPSPR
ncbi:MAG TPA: tetratricopeptide repeat protein [Chthoniobacterales bacterium]|nr:tetratricopeptide repeat protein [Chthoniobacterales bacterium]